MCFTGRINRLINSTIGFIDGVQIGLSETEQISMEIESLIRQLTAGNITKAKCKEDMEAILDPSTLHADAKRAYLDALDDY
jgi:hypothetical protein